MGKSKIIGYHNQLNEYCYEIANWNLLHNNNEEKYVFENMIVYLKEKIYNRQLQNNLRLDI